MEESSAPILEEPIVKKGRKEKKKTPLDWRMSKRERGFYYLSDTARIFGTAMFVSYLTPFLALRGVNLAWLSTILLVLRLIDAVDDVIFGYLIDKIKITEWKAFKKITGEGKYLPWFKLTFFLFPLFTVLFYLMPNSLPEWAKFAWLIVSYVLYDFSVTLNEVPMNSLVMTLTDKTDERAHILTIKGIITVIAAVAIGFLLTLLVSEVVGFTFSSVAIVGVLICLAMMLPLVLKGKEYNVGLKNVDPAVTEKYTLKDMWNVVKTNKYMMIYLLNGLILAISATGTAVGVLASFYLFGSSLTTSIPVLIAFIPAMIINAFADKIAAKVGRKNSLIILGLIYGGMGLFAYLAGYENVIVYIILTVIAGMANSLRYVFSTFIAPDTIEYTRYKTGKECAGIFYSLNAFVSKATGSIASSLGLFLLGVFGWVEVQANSFEELQALNIPQPQSAMSGMWIILMLIPAIGTLIGTSILFFYKLKDKDAELMAKCNSGQITREECETQLSRQY